MGSERCQDLESGWVNGGGRGTPPSTVSIKRLVADHVILSSRDREALALKHSHRGLTTTSRPRLETRRRAHPLWESVRAKLPSLTSDFLPFSKSFDIAGTPASRVHISKSACSPWRHHPFAVGVCGRQQEEFQGRRHQDLGPPDPSPPPQVEIILERFQTRRHRAHPRSMAQYRPPEAAI